MHYWPFLPSLFFNNAAAKSLKTFLNIYKIIETDYQSRYFITLNMYSVKIRP